MKILAFFACLGIATWIVVELTQDTEAGEGIWPYVIGGGIGYVLYLWIW